MTRVAVPGPGSQRRFTTALTEGRGLVLPAFHHAVRSGRTLFPSRVYDAGEVARVLKDGQQSRKIGKVITKGRRRGWPIYTLTLEERATCPRSCGEWQTCYGNRMQAAERIEATGPDRGRALMNRLAHEVVQLAEEHPRGFLVRLHVLGDFFSAEYVAFWAGLLRDVPPLHLFGFTAQNPAGPIGAAVVSMMAEAGWDRAAFRFSGAAGAMMAARVLNPGESDTEAIACPAQTGATDCCATCALCWHSQRSISFRRH
jgi:hypothetical protein